VRNGKRTKQKEGTWYEAGTCFMALDVSEKYQSQIHELLEHLKISVPCRRSKHRKLQGCIYLQDDSRGKVNILGGDSIGHWEKKFI
jgi:hypothetical protein